MHDDTTTHDHNESRSEAPSALFQTYVVHMLQRACSADGLPYIPEFSFFEADTSELGMARARARQRDFARRLLVVEFDDTMNS